MLPMLKHHSFVAQLGVQGEVLRACELKSTTIFCATAPLHKIVLYMV